MSLVPLRRHAIATTLHTFPGILLYQHLLCPNILILLGRFALQAQLSTPRYVSPHSSLRLWVGFIFVVNVSALALHWVDVTMGMNEEKALMLDFVGLKQSPSGTTILVLDIIIFLIQIITVYVAYLCDPLPVATTSPTVLLPPVDISDDPLLPRANEIDEGNGELQNWSVIRRRKRKGKGKVGGGFGNYLEAGEEGVVNLNEEEDEDERTTFLRRGSTPRTSHVFTDDDDDHIESTQPHTSSSSHPPIPLIFDIKLRHLLRHIISLPSPAPTPRNFSGGTPLGTPVTLSSRILADVTTTTALPGSSPPPPHQPHMNDDADSENHERIPGSYIARSTRRHGLLPLHPLNGEGNRGVGRGSGSIGDAEHGIAGD